MTKSIGIVAILLCATLAQALPQEKNGQAAAPKMKRSDMSKLVDRLTLTEEQKQEIAAIRKQTVEDNTPFLETMEKTLDELQAAREARDEAKIELIKLTVESQREELKTIQEDELRRIMDVLTREQHIQIEEMRAARERRDAQRSRQ